MPRGEKLHLIWQEKETIQKQYRIAWYFKLQV